MRERGQVYVRPPSEGLPGISANQIILLKKPVYGLDDAPMKWFRHFTSTVSKIGFTVSKLDPCIFYLRDPTQKLVGIFGLGNLGILDYGIIGFWDLWVFPSIWVIIHGFPWDFIDFAREFIDFLKMC